MRKLLQALPPLLYALGLIWVLLFPAVTISTGELKMRGTYFSENALGPAHDIIDANVDDLRWAQRFDAQYRALPWLGRGGCHDSNEPYACRRSAQWIRRRLAELLQHRQHVVRAALDRRAAL